jgi:hypothetical protein
MKKFYYLIIVLSLSLCSCFSQKTLIKEDREKIYEHSCKLSKEELKIKIMNFLNLYFISSKGVIQTNDDGIIAGNYHSKLGWVGLTKVFPVYTFIIKYSDKSFKVKIVVKQIYMGCAYCDLVDESKWGNFKDDIYKDWDNFNESLNESVIELNTF